MNLYAVVMFVIHASMRPFAPRALMKLDTQTALLLFLFSFRILPAERLFPC